MHHTDDATGLPCACTTLRKASRAVSRVYDAALAPLGLTSVQFSILRNVQRAGEVPLSRLAERLVMDRTSLYRTLAPMQRAGWVDVAAAGGRAKQVSLTAAGRKLAGAAASRWEAAQRTVVEAFGVERWTELQAGIDALTAVGVAAVGGGAEESAA